MVPAREARAGRDGVRHQQRSSRPAQSSARTRRQIVLAERVENLGPVGEHDERACLRAAAAVAVGTRPVRPRVARRGRTPGNQGQRARLTSYSNDGAEEEESEQQFHAQRRKWTCSMGGNSVRREAWRACKRVGPGRAGALPNPRLRSRAGTCAWRAAAKSAGGGARASARKHTHPLPGKEHAPHARLDSVGNRTSKRLARRWGLQHGWCQPAASAR